jgi:hypothetical protein
VDGTWMKLGPLFFKQPAFFRSVIFVVVNFEPFCQKHFQKGNIPSKFPFSKGQKRKKKKNARK